MAAGTKTTTPQIDLFMRLYMDLRTKALADNPYFATDHISLTAGPVRDYQLFLLNDKFTAQAEAAKAAYPELEATFNADIDTGNYMRAVNALDYSMSMMDESQQQDLLFDRDFIHTYHMRAEEGSTADIEQFVPDNANFQTALSTTLTVQPEGFNFFGLFGAAPKATEIAVVPVVSSPSESEILVAETETPAPETPVEEPSATVEIPPAAPVAVATMPTLEELTAPPMTLEEWIDKKYVPTPVKVAEAREKGLLPPLEEEAPLALAEAPARSWTDSLNPLGTPAYGGELTPDITSDFIKPEPEAVIDPVPELIVVAAIDQPVAPEIIATAAQPSVPAQAIKTDDFVPSTEQVALFWNTYSEVESKLEDNPEDREWITYVQADPRYTGYVEQYLATQDIPEAEKAERLAQAHTEHDASVAAIGDNYSVTEGLVADFYHEIEGSYVGNRPEAVEQPVQVAALGDGLAPITQPPVTQPSINVSEAEIQLGVSSVLQPDIKTTTTPIDPKNTFFGQYSQSPNDIIIEPLRAAEIERVQKIAAIPVVVAKAEVPLAENTFMGTSHIVDPLISEQEQRIQAAAVASELAETPAKPQVAPENTFMGSGEIIAPIISQQEQRIQVAALSTQPETETPQAEAPAKPQINIQNTFMGASQAIAPAISEQQYRIQTAALAFATPKQEIPSQPDTMNYTARSGDSLSVIASRHLEELGMENPDRKAIKLAQANIALLNPGLIEGAATANLVKIGQELKLPSKLEDLVKPTNGPVLDDKALAENMRNVRNGTAKLGDKNQGYSESFKEACEAAPASTVCSKAFNTATNLDSLSGIVMKGKPDSVATVADNNDLPLQATGTWGLPAFQK